MDGVDAPVPGMLAFRVLYGSAMGTWQPGKACYGTGSNATAISTKSSRSGKPRGGGSRDLWCARRWLWLQLSEDPEAV
jgi:hypothetical protein